MNLQRIMTRRRIAIASKHLEADSSVSQALEYYNQKLSYFYNRYRYFMRKRQPSLAVREAYKARMYEKKVEEIYDKVAPRMAPLYYKENGPNKENTVYSK